MPAFRSVVSVLVRFVVKSFSPVAIAGAMTRGPYHGICRAVIV